VISLRIAALDISRGARGRPGAPWHSLSDLVSFAYLVRLSKKHEIETSRLLDCIHHAWIAGESSFDNVSVKRRQMTEDYGVFLITRDEQIMAQLKLTSRILRYLKEVDISSLRFEGYSPTERSELEPGNLMIRDLCVDTKRFNLKAKIVEKSVPRIVLSRWGKEFVLSTVTIEDESGRMKLPLWNDSIDMFSVGDTIRIENARVKMFQGELQISVDKLTRLLSGTEQQ